MYFSLFIIYYIWRSTRQISKPFFYLYWIPGSLSFYPCFPIRPLPNRRRTYVWLMWHSTTDNLTGRAPDRCTFLRVLFFTFVIFYWRILIYYMCSFYSLGWTGPYMSNYWCTEKKGHPDPSTYQRFFPLLTVTTPTPRFPSRTPVHLSLCWRSVLGHNLRKGW